MSLALPSPDVLRHIVDVHCHPTDAPTIIPEAMENLALGTIVSMSSCSRDQVLVRNLAMSYPDKVIPCFGYHPWFTHLISLRGDISKEDHYRQLFGLGNDLEDLALLLPSLPDPIPLGNIIAELRQHLEEFPQAMLGEVGLDRSFRIPYDFSASPRRLSPFTVPIQHQISILQAQVDLAVELGRNVSLHSVKANQATTEFLAQTKVKHGNNWNKISLDLHSCGMSADSVKYIQSRYANIFVSLSTAINVRSSNYVAVIKACDPERLLVESDYNDVNMCAPQTWDMVCRVADVKEWSTETEWKDEISLEEWGAVRRLEANWMRFKAGNHSNIAHRRNMSMLK
ncbi:TatD DNase family Scn1 [Rhodocollybia butyracea]|uniref:TatD DNase family Scn1 n=1 Tax=Rhodocollybia butyracea TaxID=206335 RepID=A0A9P5PYG8_9AGAR|nr:TatD DNase family Scn1 [Rhodocollybia butyracea]